MGFVASFARPGGNITGLSGQTNIALAAKRVQLLKETLPDVSRLALLWDPKEPGHVALMQASESAAQKLDVQAWRVEVRSADTLDSALTALTRQRPGAVLNLGGAVLFADRVRIVEHLKRHRLPAMCTALEWVEAGALMAYSTSFIELHRRAAYFVDKILKGAKPADLPIEQPTKFELVINLRTAKALSLTIPPSLLQRADQVIE
jgi:putative ABC transport system substrate-binding protein